MGCCGIGIPDIQQLGEHPDWAQSCGHGCGHFKARCGGGRTWLFEGIGGGRITGDLAEAADPLSSLMLASSSASSAGPSSSSSSSLTLAACTSAFFPGPLSAFSDLVTCEACWCDFECEAFKALLSMLAVKMHRATNKMVSRHIFAKYFKCD